MMLWKTVALLAVTAVAQVQAILNSSQTILRIDNGTFGPELEEVHYYYGTYTSLVASLHSYST